MRANKRQIKVEGERKREGSELENWNPILDESIAFVLFSLVINRVNLFFMIFFFFFLKGSL